MAIPDYQSLMLPFLKIAGDGQEHYVRDVQKQLADQFKLSEAERSQLLPSGTCRIVDNRIGWARTYLKFAGLITYPRRGYFRITDRGKQVLNSGVSSINVKFLRQYPEFVAFISGGKEQKEDKKIDGNDSIDTSEVTPEEQVEAGYLKLRQQLETELLTRVKKCSPEFFEDLVVRVLVAMGYGGSLSDAGQAIGKSGDGGVDGVIKEDRLGLDVIYIQAKRWNTGTVGSPEIQKFVGALQGRKARRGVFITTSTFSKAAQDYAAAIETKVVLIDGARLAELMFDFGVGVATVRQYEVKTIDNDFFEDEDETDSPT